VLIPGFLAPRCDAQGGRVDAASLAARYWGTAAAAAARHGFAKTVPVAPSGVGSLHDRACEIFYQLVGGTVDYGEAHAREHGHARFGRTYAKGLHPSWSADNPVHLVGHSYGGTTARALRHLLATNFFGPAVNSCAAWVASVSAINAPLNGALAVYALGAKVRRKKGERSEVVPLSPGFLLGVLMHVSEFLSGANLLGLYDFGLDHFGLGLGVAKLFRSVFVRSSVFEEKDVSNYDMTCHAMRGHNARWETDAGTLYMSFVGDPVVGRGGGGGGGGDDDDDNDEERPDDHCASTSARPSSRCCTSPRAFLCGGLAWWCVVLAARAFMFVLRASVRRHWDHVLEMSRQQPCFDAEAWRASGSDGLVTTKSQSHPLGDPFVVHAGWWRKLKWRGGGSTTPNSTLADERRGATAAPLQKGVWHVYRTRHDHLGVVPFPENFDEQRAFFDHLFGHLARGRRPA
jgi:hypothetical protein